MIPALALLAGYVLIGSAALWFLERPSQFTLFSLPFAVLWGSLSALWLAWQYLKDPALFWAAVAPRRLAHALLIFAVVAPAQSIFQSLKQAIGHTIGFPWDGVLHRLDVELHGGEAWRWFAWMPSSWITALDVLYLLWFGLMLVFVLWASWTTRTKLREQAMLAFLLVWMLGGTVTAAVFASAGPCYAAHVGIPAESYGPLLETIAETQAAKNQAGIWQAHATGTMLPFGGISAFPSIHVAVAVLFALLARRCSPLLGWLAWGYALTIQIGSVVLGWHYAIDGYAGGLIAWGCWSLAGRMLRVSETQVRHTEAEAA